MGLVSIALTTYNRSAALKSAVSRILLQTYQNYEIIIVDDSSTDNTFNVVNNDILLLDSRIKYIRHESNRGLAAARNTAIRSSSGKYFTFCDDDDSWKENFLEKMVENADNFGPSWCFISGSTLSLGKDFLNVVIEFPNMTLRDAIYRGITPPVGAQFYFLVDVRGAGEYNELISSGVDHDLWLRLATNNVNLHCLKECLVLPNSFPVSDRMTTNVRKRTDGIESSLTLWRSIIEENFGVDFYHHFCDEYRYYIYRAFIIKAVRARNVKVITRLVFDFRIFKYFYRLLLDSISRNSVSILTVDTFGNKILQKQSQPSFKSFDR